ncbi:hypothetical protein CTI12_AA009980 [Artemisia annua]|uniref:Uncharacterized protein n=1 Tax=Artemisia annua TaxID=35608 RepID=A0A2U1QMT3_ARTAN|nr:hypothetical protein CTI12_AA009980 [Artemisia annua]
MASIPKFEQLKQLCGSNELKDCFKFFFVQEESETDRLITKITEWCNGLHVKIANFADLIEEGRTLTYFDVRLYGGLESLVQVQAKNGEILRALLVVLDVARAAKAENHRHVMMMEAHD